MIYKVTLLKDTPTLKAGAMWVYFLSLIHI